MSNSWETVKETAVYPPSNRYAGSKNNVMKTLY